MTDVRHPDIHVQLTGTDGNAFAILGRVGKAMLQAGLTKDEVREFSDEAMSGDYDHLLVTCMRWVDVS